MKRFERLGSVAFVTVLISLIFHLIAMSFSHWKDVTCSNCNRYDILGSWSTGIVSRCYQASMESIFNPYKNVTNIIDGNAFRTDVCVSNKILMVNYLEQASYCLRENNENGDVTCATKTYNKDYCKCDYLTRTKLVLASCIMTALSLGVLIFLSHLVAFVKKETVLKWLIPACYILLFVAIIFMFITLVAAGSDLEEDVRELRFSWSILEIIHYNDTENVAKYQNEHISTLPEKYSTKLGWCFGMEILAFYFAIISLILYLIMFLIKQRPNAIKVIM
ncbi:hypothetical protein I4U23_017368 [Adineta vaga]|nr:hypothetical protein I4U23_017368 [Adineta vaga]